MKLNVFKYIFIIFVIGLISYAGFIIYNNDKNKQTEQSLETTEVKAAVVKDIRLAIAGFDTINPILTNNTNVQNISYLIFESLLTIDQEYKIKNVLATEWSKTGDTSYIIKLKEDVKWQDGSDFTAYDVQYTIDLLKQINSIYSYQVQNIVSIDIIDNSTVKINIDAPKSFFEYNLTFPILSRAYYQTQDVYSMDKMQKSIGTGMYYISSIDSNMITLKRNLSWWGEESETPVIDTVNISLFDTMGEVYNSFKMGNLDLITTRTLNYEDYIGTIGFEKKEYPGKEHDFLSINYENNLLSRTEVRKALLYSIDKDAIIANVFGGKYYIVDFPLNYGSYLYTAQNSSLGYNPEQAKQVLMDNGWEYKYGNWQKIENYKTLRLTLNLIVQSEDTTRIQVAEIIKQNLADIGIKLNVIKVSNNQYQSYLENKNYELILTGTNISNTPDLSTYYGESNLSNFKNQEVTSILNDINNIYDEKLLKEKYERLYEIYKTEVPYISLYFNKYTVIYSSNLRGDISANTFNVFYNFNKWYREY